MGIVYLPTVHAWLMFVANEGKICSLHHGWFTIAIGSMYCLHLPLRKLTR